MAILLIYIIVFVVAFYVVHLVTKMMTAQKDYTSLKTVTFGDEALFHLIDLPQLSRF